MINFDNKYFKEMNFNRKQIEKFLSSGTKDLKIAKESKVSDVRFQFTYNALIKLGITLIACFNYKVSSRTGHHRKIIEKLSEILEDEDILLYGNKLRKIRNTELYDSGIMVTDKQSEEFLDFVQKTYSLSQVFLKNHFHNLI